MNRPDLWEAEIVHTPADKHRVAMPVESLRRGNGNAPRQPALWNAVEVNLPLPDACYGRYPKGFLDWALRVLDVPGREVLHVCTGGMSREDARGGFRVDMRSAAAPDVLGDGRNLPIRSGSVAAVLIDPPYSVQYAETLYGVDYPRPSHLLAEAARVVRPRGAIGFLHYLVPVPPVGCSLERVFGVTQGLGYRIRAWCVFRRHAASLFPESTP